MDHNSIIDRKNYQVYTHAEDYPNAFICDKRIAPAIAILNQKGYKTIASCSGHYEICFYEWLDTPIEELSEIKKDNHCIIKNTKENTFDYWSEKLFTSSYILFDRLYEFKIIPDEFKLDKDVVENKINIFHDIYFYDEFDNHKSRREIENEIDKYSDILINWAKSLPERKDD